MITPHNSSIINLPDRLKGYLFQVKLNDIPTDISNDYMLRFKCFDKYNNQIKLTAQEFQDFAVFKNEHYLKDVKSLTVKFYSSNNTELIGEITYNVKYLYLSYSLDLSSNEAVEPELYFNLV